MRVMESLRKRLSRPAGEAGFTLVEVVVVTLLIGVVSIIFLSAMARVQTSLTRATERSDNNDQARLAVQRIDREVRSGNLLYDPALEAPAELQYYQLRVYTQANATTRTPGNLCVLWKIEDQQLVRRTWPPGEPENANGWSVVVDGVVNVDQGVRAFQLDPDAAKGGRTVQVTLLVDKRPGVNPDQTIQIQTSVTGRNSTFDYPENVCTPVPS
jgi:prepilin-type N-terminal cleavage/methylation domain-containing protein